MVALTGLFGDVLRSVDVPPGRSHREVAADKITRIQRLPPLDREPNELDLPNDSRIRWVLDCGGIVDVTKDMVLRGAPSVGDYFVQYEDGYKSWLPGGG